MAGHYFINVAAGKPQFTSRCGTTTTQQVDLLWRYKFNWIIIDRWDNSELPSEDTAAEIENPLTSIRYSVDGAEFIEAKIAQVELVSAKGSVGNRRSLQIHFREAIHSQHIKIEFAANNWRYQIRASQRDFQLEATEKGKLICGLPTPNKAFINANRLRAIVLGGSNSVMRFGWTRGAERAGIDIVQNVSLGSSSNAILATQLENIDTTNVDLILVNSTVNDYRPMRDGVYDLQLAKQFVRFIQVWCAKNNVMPIFLIYPHRHILDDERAGRVPFDQEGYCIELCEDLDVPYINVFPLLDHLSTKWGRSKESLYLDPAHLNHPTAQALGSIIGERVWRFMAYGTAGVERNVSTKKLAHNFKIMNLESSRMKVEAIDGASTSVSKRRVETSLVSQNMLTIVGGQRIYLDIPDGYEVVAFTMNARRCNTGIRVSGTNVVSRRADFGKYGGSDGYPFVCVRSFITAITPENGQISIECVQPEAWFEPDEVTNASIIETPVDEMELELSQIVLRERIRTMPFMRVRNIDLDLTPECLFSHLTD